MKPLMLKHLSGEPIGRFPVWMMRQAGRYLPSYRAVREKHSFWEMVTKPEVAAEVSLQPIRQLPVDAAIFFSDILTLPYGMGVPVQMKESVGPVLEQPFSLVDFEKFAEFDADKHTPFVARTLELIAKELPSDKALLGFAGAPWTLACYLMEGRSSRHFEMAKSALFQDPKGLSGAMEYLAEATVRYLAMQKRSGAHMAQLFDTWIGEMPRDFFTERYVPLLNLIFQKSRAIGLPMIYYTKASHHILHDFELLDVDVLSVDSLVGLKEVEEKTGGWFSLQGNLDPVLLLKADVGVVRQATRKLVQQARLLKKPAIMNLGHGILPKTPVENARAFLEEASTLWV